MATDKFAIPYPDLSAMPPDELLAAMQAHDTPFARHLGLVLTEVTRDLVRAELPVREEVCTSPTRIHGGAIMAFADNLGAIATVVNLPPGASTTTIESKTNFLAAIPQGQKALGETTPIHKGRTTMVWQTRISREDGRLAAIVTQTQMVLPGKAP